MEGRSSRMSGLHKHFSTSLELLGLAVFLTDHCVSNLTTGKAAEVGVNVWPDTVSQNIVRLWSGISFRLVHLGRHSVCKTSTYKFWTRGERNDGVSGVCGYQRVRFEHICLKLTTLNPHIILIRPSEFHFYGAPKPTLDQRWQ